VIYLLSKAIGKKSLLEVKSYCQWLKTTILPLLIYLNKCMMKYEVFVSKTTKLLKNIQTDISKAVNSNTPVISNNLQTEDNLEGMYYFTDNTVFYKGKYKYNLIL